MCRQRSLIFAALLAASRSLLIVSANNEFIPKVPQECLQMGFCENLPDYPTQRVSDIIKQLGPELDKYKVQIDATVLQVRNGEEEELCDFDHKTITPMAAPDHSGEWHFVINQKQPPLRSFIVEVCKEAGSPCSNLAYFNTGYTASCKQKYIYRNTPILDGDGAMVEKQLLFPSSCSCQFQKAGDP